MLLTNNIHIYFSDNVYVCLLYFCYILFAYCRHTHDCCYMIMFNVYIMALLCFDGYARVATLITDRLQIALILILTAFTETQHLWLRLSEIIKKLYVIGKSTGDIYCCFQILCHLLKKFQQIFQFLYLADSYKFNYNNKIMPKFIAEETSLTYKTVS